MTGRYRKCSFCGFATHPRRLRQIYEFLVICLDCELYQENRKALRKSGRLAYRTQ